jgi:arginyl-tRNA synthetase
VIGAPQHLHLQMVFATAREAGWLPDDVEPVHVQIGNVLGDDGKILKTRSGTPIRLMALLQEAVQRASAVVDTARPDLDAQTRADIAQQVGIGAVKYADLSVAHTSEYAFDFDRMLSLTGNTGPYLQYAAARIRSIFRRASLDPDLAIGPILIGRPTERALAVILLDFGSIVAEVGASLEPHRLCGYLFDLAQALTAFYEHCPVLKAEDEATRSSRLALIAVTLRVLTQGLDLLGVRSPERM